MTIKEQIARRIKLIAPTQEGRARVLGFCLRRTHELENGKIPRVVLTLVEAGVLEVKETTDAK